LNRAGVLKKQEQQSRVQDRYRHGYLALSKGDLSNSISRDAVVLNPRLAFADIAIWTILVHYRYRFRKIYMSKGATNTDRLTLIISGGQTGADQGALSAARDLGIPTGGTAPQGWLTEAGPQEALLRGFGLSECPEAGYPARTRQNVLDADGTLLVGLFDTGGSALTAAVAQDERRPMFHLAFTAGTPREKQCEEFRRWLRQHDVRVLNVAGNRESECPGIQAFTRSFLIAALQ
jgi:hypothetical protein